MKSLVAVLSLFFVVCWLPSIAQQKSYTYQFIDSFSSLPVSSVKIIDLKGRQVGESNDAGNVTLPGSVFDSAACLIAMHHNYAVDTLRGYAGKLIVMRHLTGTLNTVEITAVKTVCLLNESNEYVADYDFAGGGVVVATYSGRGGRHARLFLVDDHAREVAAVDMPQEPLRLFTSCVGRCYYVCSNRFYPLVIDSSSITVRTPYDIKLLDGMEQCDLSINGNLYYRRGNKTYFSMTYEMLAKDDSVMRPITGFSEPDVAEASMDEYFRILSLMGGRNFSDAAKLQMARRKWDNGSYSHINLPVFRTGSDTLVIFNYLRKRIEYYNLSGKLTGTCPIRFEWKQLQQFEILRDEPRNKFYIHRYNAPSVQTVEELNINTGQVVTNRIRLEKPFADRVKMHDGSIYYLWQNNHSPATRQLFRQHM